MASTQRPDWQLPPGVDRGLWDYLNSPLVAREYDTQMRDHPLFCADQAFVERHCSPAERLLDLGCGTGRLLLPLAREGYSVVGVDLSREMLDVARRRAAEEGLSIPLLQANLVRLDCLESGSFGSAVCLFSTLGMVVGARARSEVLGHVHRVLRPGGRFILHVHNYWFNLYDRGGRSWLLRDLLGWRSGEAGNRRMPPHQGVANLSLHHFGRREVVGLLERGGFRIVELLPLDARARPVRWPGWLRAAGFLIAAEREP
jgi:SAM-dependent methyltransferase